MNKNNQKTKQETTQNNNNKRNTLKLTRIGIEKNNSKEIILTTKDDFLCDSLYAVFVGQTGSGKSYAILSFLGKVALYNPSNTCTYHCDPKGNEQNFMQFEGSPHYYLGIEKSVDGQ